MAKKKPSKKACAAYLQIKFQETVNEAPSHGIRHPELIQAAGNVICRGHRKPVYLINGRFVITDGHNKKREHAVAELGGDKCRCFGALHEWAEHRTSKLPIMFHEFAYAARKKQIERKKLKQVRGYNENITPGAFGQLQRKARLLLRYKCRYVMTRRTDCRICARSSTYATHAYGYFFTKGEKITTRDHGMRLDLCTAWKKILSPMGLAVVDGYFLLNILVYEAGHKIYLSLRDLKRLVKETREKKGTLQVLIIVETCQYYGGCSREYTLISEEATLIMEDKPRLKLPPQ